MEVYLQAARGLPAAHAKGVVHPYILGEGGRVRVVDFGLPRQVERLEGSPAATCRASCRC